MISLQDVSFNKQLISNSLFQVALFLEGTDEIHFFLQLCLLCTYIIESSLSSQKRSEKLEYFSLLKKGQHLFLKVTTWYYTFV